MVAAMLERLAKFLRHERWLIPVAMMFSGAFGAIAAKFSVPWQEAAQLRGMIADSARALRVADSAGTARDDSLHRALLMEVRARDSSQAVRLGDISEAVNNGTAVLCIVARKLDPTIVSDGCGELRPPSRR